MSRSLVVTLEIPIDESSELSDVDILSSISIFQEEVLDGLIVYRRGSQEKNDDEISFILKDAEATIISKSINHK
jgi:hypothetical protein